MAKSKPPQDRGGPGRRVVAFRTPKEPPRFLEMTIKAPPAVKRLLAAIGCRTMYDVYGLSDAKIASARKFEEADGEWRALVRWIDRSRREYKRHSRRGLERLLRPKR